MYLNEAKSVFTTLKSYLCYIKDKNDNNKLKVYSSHRENKTVQTKRGDPVVSSKQYSICFNDLQVKLVAQSNLEYAVLSISQFESLANTPIVTSIKLEIVVFVRKTYWDRNIYRLCLY